MGIFGNAINKALYLKQAGYAGAGVSAVRIESILGDFRGVIMNRHFPDGRGYFI